MNEDNLELAYSLLSLLSRWLIIELIADDNTTTFSLSQFDHRLCLSSFRSLPFLTVIFVAFFANPSITVFVFTDVNVSRENMECDLVMDRRDTSGIERNSLRALSVASFHLRGRYNTARSHAFRHAADRLFILRPKSETPRRSRILCYGFILSVTCPSQVPLLLCPRSTRFRLPVYRFFAVQIFFIFFTRHDFKAAIIKCDKPLR